MMLQLTADVGLPVGDIVTTLGDLVGWYKDNNGCKIRKGQRNTNQGLR